jgi:hypothetical protein
MSQMGQNRKYSPRANNVCSGPDNGHRTISASRRKSAISRHEGRPSQPPCLRVAKSPLGATDRLP